MNAGATKVRLGWIALLTIALVMTALQAKLGLYHPRQSQDHLISKVFKPSECRLERSVPDAPVVEANAAIIAEVHESDRLPEPNFPDFSPAEPQPLLLSCTHWFRPPPVRS